MRVSRRPQKTKETGKLNQIMTKDYRIEKPDQERRYKNVNEATSVWKSFVEGEGTGNSGAELLEEIREVITEIPELLDGCFKVSNDRTAY